MPSLQMHEREALGQDSQESLGPRKLRSEKPEGTALGNKGRSGDGNSRRKPKCSQSKQGLGSQSRMMEPFRTVLLKETEAQRGRQWGPQADSPSSFSVAPHIGDPG